MSKIEWSDYQKDIFNFVKYGDCSGIVRALAGCLTGDTVINFNRQKKGFKKTIGAAYQSLHHKGCSADHFWDKSYPTFVRAFNGDYIRLHKIQDIVCNGVQTVYLLKLENGLSIKATANHKFITDNHQWVELRNLSVGTKLMCDQLNAISMVNESRPKVRDHMYRGLIYHPNGGRDGDYGTRIEEHRAVYEAHMNSMSVEKYIYILKNDEVKSSKLKFIDTKKYCLHHKNHDHFDNDIDNLELMSKSEHSRHHAKHKNLNQGIPKYSKIKSITRCRRLEMTYDIVCEDPHRNFVANGIVVHNSAKTTTLMKAAAEVPRTSSMCFTAFNKAIAQELSSKAPFHADVRTMNGLGHRAWYRYVNNNLELVPNKLSKLLRNEAFNEHRQLLKNFSSQVIKLVDLARIYGIVPGNKLEYLSSDIPDNWLHIVHEHDIDITTPDDRDPELVRIRTNQLVDCARTLLNYSIEVSREYIDFTDQIYLPAVYRVPMTKYDFMMVDEAQDISSIQNILIQRSLRREGRALITGDEFQAIYKWRGAGLDSMAVLSEQYDCMELELPISYRCSRSVVKVANQYVPHMQAWSGALDGSVRRYGVIKDTNILKPGDFVISRINANLIRLAFMIIKDSKNPVQIFGRDFSRTLLNIIKKVKAENIKDLKTKLVEFETAEIALAASSGGSDTKKERIMEKYECMRIIAQFCNSMDQVYSFIDTMFGESDPSQSINLMTAFRAKGLESDRVFILDDNIYEAIRKKAAASNNPEANVQQEDNVKYVAVTRSKDFLGYIDLPSERS